MEYIKKYKILIICFIPILILVLFLISDNKEVKADDIILTSSSIVENVNTIKIEIKGAVKNTGVYELSSDARVVDAINASGGLLKTADTTNINMSAKLTDAGVLDVPYQDEIIVNSIKVDIKGAVNIPGVYELNDGARIIDVIKLSGGLNDEADTSNINLSKRIFDEMVIIIYTKEEVNNMDDDIMFEKDNLSNSDIEIKDETIIENIKISINSATKEQLMTLSGIGESKALAIIEYRNNTKFNSIEELTNVPGIGQSIYEKIKNNITT